MAVVVEALAGMGPGFAGAAIAAIADLRVDHFHTGMKIIEPGIDRVGKHYLDHRGRAERFRRNCLGRNENYYTDCIGGGIRILWYSQAVSLV